MMIYRSNSICRCARSAGYYKHIVSARRQCWEHVYSPLHFCVQVCRSAGYYEHALAVSQAANEPEWYLDILLEDCQQYDQALAYLQKLPRQQAAAALTRHGKVGELSAEDYSVWQGKNIRLLSLHAKLQSHVRHIGGTSIELLRCPCIQDPMKTSMCAAALASPGVSQIGQRCKAQT